MTTEEKKRAALDQFNYLFRIFEDNEVLSDALRYEIFLRASQIHANGTKKTIRTLLQPSPVDAEVREAVDVVKRHDVIIVEGIGEDLWNAISTLIRSATKNMGDK